MAVPFIAADDADQRKPNTETKNTDNTKLITGLRLQNPLSNFSSYAYHLTLYLCTPEAITRFNNTGKFDRNEKENYIIAQSGGLSDADRRALTFSGKLNPNSHEQGYDYYIEDLTIEMVAPAGSSPTIPTKFTFKIVEPLGFTFLTKMANAAGEINKTSPIIQKTTQRPNLYQQHYVMGIRFYGYDENGNILSQNDIAPERVTIGTSRDNYSFFEKFFSILLTKSSFALNGKAVTYSFEATPLGNQSALAEKRGLFKQQTTIVASTVGEALLGNSNASSSGSSRSLVQLLNEQQNDEKDTNRIKYKTVYNIEFIDDEISTESLLDDNEYDLAATAMTGVSKTAQSNAKVITTTHENKKKQIAITAGTPIISVINNIISKSSYISKKLTSINNQRIETASASNSSNLELIWFSVMPISEPIFVDPETHDWVYKITYRIQKYYIPYLRSPYKKKTSTYYGPHKQYQYIFTGQNTEIINYEQEFNTLFYVIRSTSTTPDNIGSSEVSSEVPVHTQGGTNSSQNQNKQNRGSEIASNVTSNVNNVADLAIAKVKINGDPDYLMQQILASTPVNENFNRLYGSDGTSINLYGGQIFFEIIFRAAEDYQDSDGLLDVNDSIKFYTSVAAAKEAGIKGVVYRLLKVTNYFNRGSFTQDIEGVIVSESELGLIKTTDQAREPQTTQNDTPDAYLTPNKPNTVTLANTDDNRPYRNDTRYFEGRQLPISSTAQSNAGRRKV